MKTLFTLASAFTLLLAATHAPAQIRTDASLGQPGKTLSGPNYAIPQALGKLSGSNLFHSFQTFNLATGEAANFSTTSPGIANVISRVTGGDMSQINGTLRLTAASGTPAFFFINPAGITFGAGANVDVPGAFHVSTANSVKFADGRFNADLGQGSTFSSAAPEAFGFLGSTRATVTVKDGAVLRPQKAFPISIVAGDILLDGGGFGTKAGEVRAVAVGATQADIAIMQSGLGPVPAVTGNLAVINGGFIQSVSLGAASAGQITVRAGDVGVDSNATISSVGIAAEPGGAGRIDIQANQGVLLSNGGRITSGNAGSGPAGDIQIQANRITLQSEGYVYSTAPVGSMLAGANIIVRGTEMVTLNNGSITTDARSSGNAGNILIQSRIIEIVARGYVASDTYTGSTGNTGDISLAATDSISLSELGRVYASTAATGRAGSVKLAAGDITLRSLASVDSIALEGTANAGDVEIIASKTLLLDRASLFSIANSTGNAGSVLARAHDITLDNHSIISSTAERGSGNAGSVTVEASGTLALRNGGFIDSSTTTAGQAGSIKVSGGNISLANESLISSVAYDGTGNAGQIDVTSAGALTLASDSAITSNTFTAGNAGLVRITARDIGLASGGRIGTAASSSPDVPVNGGNAGSISVFASGTLLITDGYLSSGTFTSGRAGSIDVEAGSIKLQGATSKITAAANDASGGQAGTIRLRASDLISVSDNAFISITNFAIPANTSQLVPTTLSLAAPNINIFDKGFISADSVGTVAASNIDVRFSRQLGLVNSRIGTQATLGNGGSITIAGGQLIGLEQSQITTSVLGAGGNGGDIRISADALVLNSGFIQANTQAKSASGGQVNLDVTTLVANGNTLFVGRQTPFSFTPNVFGFNVIQAAAPTGVSGTIQIASPVLDLSGTLGRLGAAPIDTVILGRSPCQATGGSSLAQVGRGKLPVPYRGLLGALPDARSGALPIAMPDALRVPVVGASLGMGTPLTPLAPFMQLAQLTPGCQ